MGDNIKIRGGNKKGMPILGDREPAFVRDEKAFYIGTPEGNLKLCGADTEKKVEELEKKVTDMGQTGASFTTDETLTLEDGVLRVNTASKVEEDNTLPITAAAVHTTVGNIEILLATI